MGRPDMEVLVGVSTVGKDRKPPPSSSSSSSQPPTESAQSIPLSSLESTDSKYARALDENKPSPTSTPTLISFSKPSSAAASPTKPIPPGLSPVRHIASSWKIRGGTMAKKLGYDAVADDDSDIDGFDDTASDTLYVDEEVTISHAPRRRNRRPWIVCATACGITVLGVLLVLNILLFLSSRAWADRDEEDDIFGNWGRPGTGTEGLAWYPTDFLRDVQPIACHSHNDYWRKVPLFSALHAGCIGTEADVWLFPDRGDDLFVGHDTAALQPNRTFRALYVDPLVEILKRQNPSHSFYNDSRRGVFDVDPQQTLTLLVDVKTDGAATWRKVVEQLEPLRSRGWLSKFDNGRVTYGPITVVGTGNTPFDVLMENTTYRDYFYDAPLDALSDDGGKFDTTNSYYSSTQFSNAVGSVWFSGLRPGQLRTLRKQVSAAHAKGLKARYWDLPAWPVHVRNDVWRVLVREGVDLLNVDNLRAASRKDWTKSWPF